jgi:hypothetical protein
MFVTPCGDLKGAGGLRLLRAHHPHGEELGAAAVAVAEGGARAVDLVLPRLAPHLHCRLGEAQHAPRAARATAVPRNRLWIKGVPRNIPEYRVRGCSDARPSWHGCALGCSLTSTPGEAASDLRTYST